MQAATQPFFLAATLNPNSRPSSLPWERVRERATSRKACILGDLGIGKDCRHSGECPLPNPPPRGRERVAADSGVAGRLKKNARNINSGNFSGSLYLKADGTNAASVFQTAFEPTGSVCTARHARGGLGLQGKWRMRAYRTHPTYGLRLACCNQ